MDFNMKMQILFIFGFISSREYQIKQQSYHIREAILIKKI